MRRIGEWSTRAVQWLAMLALAAMMAHLCADIAMRNLVGRPLDGTLEVVAELYMPFVAFGALAATHLRGEEIRVDLIAYLVPAASLPWVGRAGQVLMVASAGAMAWLTGGHAVRAFEIGERIEAGGVVIAAWPGKVMVVVGFTLLALAALMRLFEGTDDGSV
ncbi:MAG: TRAP transporter small permease subunit [Roseitalea sp.]|jgi:TRAP-type C4-dicarboxylate transport system permease small subunit|nr:TRAP transporter small permease subunit [Roseitalea sp.]MBO6720397.1 TRAP transporter small permease subunit [Roseitalea sp.]MBO6742757.1 TRAP transporter small permease subunit [Roseitalea sp.]